MKKQYHLFTLFMSLMIISCRQKDTTPLPLMLPAAPSKLITIERVTEVGLEWTTNSTNETRFNIERKTGTDNYALLKTIPTSIFHTGGYNDYAILPGTTFSYRVSAYNSAGTYDYSNEILLVVSVFTDPFSPRRQSPIISLICDG